MAKITIAIDGYSSCGKSTLAKALAGHFRYRYIDSGAMYRAVTLYFIRQNVDLDLESEVRGALSDIHLGFGDSSTGHSEILLNDEPVGRLIREMTVAEKVSEVAALHHVREFAVGQQQRMGEEKGIVMDGRDIGTVVFPNAELKLFMTADPEIRVKRRFEELYNTNRNITLDEVRHNLEMRDYIDSNRVESPLRQASDAIVLNNSHMTPVQQLEKAIHWVEQRIGRVEVV